MGMPAPGPVDFSRSPTVLKPLRHANWLVGPMATPVGMAAIPWLPWNARTLLLPASHGSARMYGHPIEGNTSSRSRQAGDSGGMKS